MVALPPAIIVTILLPSDTLSTDGTAQDPVRDPVDDTSEGRRAARPPDRAPGGGSDRRRTAAPGHAAAVVASARAHARRLAQHRSRSLRGADRARLPAQPPRGRDVRR